MPLGDLHILKEWELGEEEMIQKFIVDSSIVDSYDFNFIPVGSRLGFEHKFLLEKSRKYNKSLINVLSRPRIDLETVLILMNGGEFKNSGLDKMTGKEHSGGDVPIWYRSKQYDRIENYIVQETQEFLRFYRWLNKKMPELHGRFRDFMNDASSFNQI